MAPPPDHLYYTDISPGDDGDVLSVYIAPSDDPVLRLSRRGRALNLAWAQGEAWTVQRLRRGLFPRWVLMQGAIALWTLDTLSPLRYRHRLTLASGEHWDLRTPFFSVRVTGHGPAGQRLRGWIGHSKSDWFAGYSPLSADPDSTLDVQPMPLHLLAALATLHWCWFFTL